MPKIKVEKEMTLPELIEWAWKNDVKNRKFISSNYGNVRFYSDGWVSAYDIERDETFTVEVEEEITEKTILPVFLEICTIGDEMDHSTIIRNESIKHILEDNDEALTTKTIHLINDDDTMTLLWKNGAMVDD